MTIKQKLVAALAVFSIAILLQAGFTIYKTDHIRSSAKDITTLYNPAVIKINNFKIAVIQIQQWFSDISATRGLDGLDDGLVVAREQYEIASRLIDELALLDELNQKAYQDMKPALDNYFRVGNTMAQTYIDQGPAGGNKMMPKFDAVAEMINDKLDTVLNNVESRAADISKEQAEAVSALETFVFSVTALLLVIVVVVFVSIYRAVVHPILAMSEMARDIAEGDGDLTKRLDESRADEIGITAGWINRFVERTQNTVSTISHVNIELQQAVKDLSLNAERTNEGMGVQQKETLQAATAMTQMEASAHEISQHASETAHRTEYVNAQSREGNKITEATVLQISEMESEMNAARLVMEQLAQDCEKIGAVLGVIESISGQTNLLALNAAIEAARAGEQGRGFAVVADEVRTLAGRSHQSTVEIQIIVDNLQASMAKASAVIDRGNDQAHRTGESINQVRDALEAINESISEINLMNTQIASAAEEQSQVSQTISHNINNISVASDHNTQSAHEVYQTSDQLLVNVDKLSNLIAGFKI